MARAATERLKVAPPQGSLPVLQYCTPDQLQIDPDYQRGIEAGPSQTLIRRIAMHWDWTLCQPLMVARRSHGALYVVDGQHRLAAAKLRGDIWQLPCVVTAFPDAAGEAAAFVALNQARRPLQRLDVFRAALAAGDEDAKTILAAIEEAGLKLSGSTNNRAIAVGAISNVGGLQACLRSHGQPVLQGSLEVLHASYGHEVLRFAGTLFGGIAAIVATEMASASGKPFLDHPMFDVMVDMIRAADQTEWYRDIQAARADPDLSQKEASIKVFADAWRECVDAMRDAA